MTVHAICKSQMLESKLVLGSLRLNAGFLGGERSSDFGTSLIQQEIWLLFLEGFLVFNMISIRQLGQTFISLDHDLPTPTPGRYFEGARLGQVTCWVCYCPVSWLVRFFRRSATKYISHLPSS